MVCNGRAARIPGSRISHQDLANCAAKCGYGDRSSRVMKANAQRRTLNVQRPSQKKHPAHNRNRFLYPPPSFDVELRITTMEREANSPPSRRTKTTQLKWLHWLGLRDFPAAFLARATGIIVPEIEHRLAEMFNDIAAIEIDVFHQLPAIVTIEDDVFVFTRRPATLDHHTNRVRRPDRRVRNIGRNKKRFPFPYEMIHNAIALVDAHLDVAFELVEIFLRIDEMKIVPRVRTLDHHHEKIAAIIEVAVAHRRFEFVAVLFNPAHQVDWRLDGACAFLDS